MIEVMSKAVNACLIVERRVRKAEQWLKSAAELLPRMVRSLVLELLGLQDMQDLQRNLELVKSLVQAAFEVLESCLKAEEKSIEPMKEVCS